MLNFIGKVFKLILTVFVIFLMPFIIPLIFKLMEHLKIFSGVKELTDIMTIFNNKYTLTYVVIGAILMLTYFHNWGNIKGMVKNLFNKIKGIKGEFSFKDNKPWFSFETTKEVMSDINNQKEFISSISKDNKNCDSQNSMKEIKNLLGIGKGQVHASECSKCDMSEIKYENEKLRNFATYNMLNTDARSILHVIYNEKYMKKSTFKSRIIQGYKRRNKRNIKIANKDINKIAQNKYDTIYEGLKFLNIIEPSEDDTTIKLTQEGKKFVEKYIEKKEVV